MKLLAIDDNLAVLHMLRKQIEVDRLGITILDVANSAGEARELVQQHLYDIVLCDIEMPGEDGISFAKWLLEKQPSVKLIFLTSHADFAYMKQAISMHSFDYLLQPAIPLELNQVIQKAIFAIQTEQKQRELLAKAELYEDQEKNIVNWAIMQYLEQGEEIEAGLLNLIQEKYSLPEQGEKIALVTIRVFGEDNLLAMMKGELGEFVLGNIFNELSEADRVRAVFMQKGSDAFVGAVYAMPEYSNTTILHEKLVKLRYYLDELYQADVVIYFTIYTDVGRSHELYSKIDAFQVESVPRKGEVLLVEESEEHSGKGKTIESHVNYWKKLLNEKKYEIFRESVFRYLDNISASSSFNSGNMIDIHAKFTNMFLSYLLDSEIESGEMFGDEMSYTQYMSTYKSVELFKTMVSYVADKLGQMCSEDMDPVKRVVQYMKSHIDKDISVTELAAYVYLSPEHLTRLLKKETGYSLKEYLIRMRLDTAKMLLENTNLTVTQVASHVGYSNYNNFIKIFKKYEGYTPSEYRNVYEK